VKSFSLAAVARKILGEYIASIFRASASKESIGRSSRDTEQEANLQQINRSNLKKRTKPLIQVQIEKGGRNRNSRCWGRSEGNKEAPHNTHVQRKTQHKRG
jgi:hypothetical protein